MINKLRSTAIAAVAVLIASAVGASAQDQGSRAGVNSGLDNGIPAGAATSPGTRSPPIPTTGPEAVIPTPGGGPPNSPNAVERHRSSGEGSGPRGGNPN